MNEVISKEVISEEVIEATRDMMGHEARLMYFILQAGREDGLDLEKYLRASVKKNGSLEGAEVAECCEDLKNLASYAEVFADDYWTRIHEMEIMESERDRLQINYHRCPFMDGLKDIKCSKTDIAKICSIIQDADWQIADDQGYKFSVGKAIGEGCEYCELFFEK